VGLKIIERTKCVRIKSEKPDSPEKAKCVGFNTCKLTTGVVASEDIAQGLINIKFGPHDLWKRDGVTATEEWSGRNVPDSHLSIFRQIGTLCRPEISTRLR
jgi:hypothetical protein